jgi:spore coat polysaccharide biosynthesis protein SpsF
MQLVLGTAQLGFTYGAANRSGQPSEAAAIDIIRAAARSGIRTIDTARAYGTSEDRIGLALSASNLPPVTVVTKLDTMPDIPSDASPDVIEAAVLRSLAASRKALRRDRLDVVLLHKPSHRVDWGGTIWRTLIRERDRGTICRLGVSVQSPKDACAALLDHNVEHLQLPLNLLDQRWTNLEFIDARNARSNVTFHVRSVLLQGLLANTPDARWPIFNDWSPVKLVDDLHQITRSFGRADIIDFCIAWVRAQNWIDGVILGMETVEQLNANLAYFRNPALSVDECATVYKSLSDFPKDLIDPPSWSKERRPLSSWRNT